MIDVSVDIAAFIKTERERIVKAWSGGLEDFASYQKWLGKWQQLLVLESFMADAKLKRGDDDDEQSGNRRTGRAHTSRGVGTEGDGW
jgi:hypothetical protein